jgi:tetratricopeptide (TPR) repeat protein
MQLFAAATILCTMLAASQGDELAGAMGAQRFGDVLRIVDARLAAQPRDVRLLTIRGIALGRLNRLPESLAAFERALAVDPNSIPALKGATEVAYRARSPKAAALVTRVLALEPQDETAHAMAAVLAVEADKCDVAIRHFERSGAALDANASALSQYGGCLLRRDRPKEAVTVFERAVRVSGDRSASQYNLAVAALQARDPARAVDAAERALALAPGDANALSVFAAASAEAGRLQPAIDALRKAIAIAPDEERYYMDLAVLCMEHDAPDLALEVTNAGLSRLPASARLYTLRGAIHADRAELDEATRDFEQAASLSPDALYGSVGLSLVLRQNAQLPEAITLLRSKLAQKPQDATLNYLLGDALMRSEPAAGTPVFREAEQAFRRAVKARPQFAKAHAALGKLYLRSGDAAAAAEKLAAAVRMDPGDRLALNQLVMAYRQLGRAAEAAEAAAQLKDVLDRERTEEVARNRMRLVRGTDPAPPPR